jgi:acyl-CoA thioesterase
MTDAKADALASRVAQAMLSREGTGPSWQLVIEEARLGYARVRMLGRPDMANGHGIIHGGMIFALADTAFAYACNSRNAAAVAASASIAFLSPAKIGETLVAEADERMRDGRSGAYSVSVRTADGRAVAEFQGVSREIGGAILDPLEESE